MKLIPDWVFPILFAVGMLAFIASGIAQIDRAEAERIQYRQQVQQRYCDVKFAAAKTALDSVRVLDNTSRYDCSFSLLPRKR